MPTAVMQIFSGTEIVFWDDVQRRLAEQRWEEREGRPGMDWTELRIGCSAGTD